LGSKKINNREICNDEMRSKKEGRGSSDPNTLLFNIGKESEDAEN
jgi:hypothetical protein